MKILIDDKEIKDMPEHFSIVYSGAKTYTNTDGVLIQGPRFPIPGLTDF